MPSQPDEKRNERLGDFESRSVKTLDVVEGFQLHEIKIIIITVIIVIIIIIIIVIITMRVISGH